MKRRFLIFSLFIFTTLTLTPKSLFWDKPRKILENLSFVRINEGEGKTRLISYSAKDREGYSIYIIFRNADGTYSKAKKVFGPIKTDRPDSLNPTAALNGKRVFITWKGTDNAIYYVKSENSGDIFTDPKKIVVSDETLFMPFTYFNINRLFVFFHKKSENSLNIDIQYIFSDDGGVSFSPAKKLVSTYSFSFSPYVLFNRSQIHVLWESRPPVSQGAQTVPFEIYYKFSSDNGNSWASENRITKDHGSNHNPKGYFYNGVLYTVWESNKDGNFAIYSTPIKQNDNLLPHQRTISRISKTATNCKQASITRLGDFLYIFWKDLRDGNENIYYNTLHLKNNEIGNDRNAIFSRENSVYPYPVIQNNAISILYLDRKAQTYILNESYPDTTTSNIEVSIPELNQETGYINKRKISIRWKPIQDAAGIDKIYFTVDNSPYSTPEALENNEIPEGDLSITREFSDGTYYFHIFYIDKAGNRSKVSHAKFIVDTVPPPEPQPYLPGENTFADKKKNIIGVMQGVIQWIRSDDDYQYEYVLSTFPKFFQHLAKKMSATQVKFNLPDDGTYYFHIRSIDKAGNMSQIKTFTFQIKIDMNLIAAQGIFVRQPVRYVISSALSNINLPALPMNDINPGSLYTKMSFMDFPIVVKIKYTLITFTAFVLILFLLIYFVSRNRHLSKTIDTIRALPPKEVKSLPIPKEYEVEIAKMSLPDEIEIRAVPRDSVIMHKNSEDMLVSVEVDLLNPHYSKPDDRQYSDNYANSDKTEAYEEAETIKNAEIYEDAEPIEAAEACEETEPIEAAEACEEAEPIEAAEAFEETEPIEAAEAYEEAEPIEAAEAYEEAEPIEAAEAYEEAEPIETAEVYETAEPIETAEAYEYTEPVQHDVKPEITETISGKPKKIKLKEGIFGLKFKYSFLVLVIVLMTVTIGTAIIGYVTQRSSKENLATESMEKIKAVMRSLNYATITGIETSTDFIILENLGFTKRDVDISDAFIVRWALDIESGKLRWMKINRDGLPSPFEDNNVFSRVKEITKKEGKNAYYISPNFEPASLRDSYFIYSPVLRTGMGEEINDQLFENKRKFLGLVAVKFSTKRIVVKVDEVQKQLTRLNIIIGLAMIVFGIVIAIGFTTLMIKPIYHLASGVQIVGTGNLDYKIEVKTKDEIGALAKQFNKMTGELKIAQEEMFKKKLLEEQFSLAEGIQTSLIPIDTYTTQHVEIVGFYRSALGVGGDYYDFFKIDEERTAVIICDVAGKGIPASLIMVQIRTIFRTFMDLQSTSAAKLVELVNNTLCQSLQAGLFATMLFIIYNSKTKELMFSNAGHGPLEYLSVKTNKIEKVTVESPPTGVMPGVKYEDKKVKMSAGDIVYLYTDGISEAMSMTREEYGNDRLEGMIKKNAKASAEYINSSLISDLAEFVGDAEQSDDISLIVMKIKQ